MSRTRVSMTVLFSSVGVGLLNLLFMTVASSDEGLDRRIRQDRTRTVASRTLWLMMTRSPT